MEEEVWLQTFALNRVHSGPLNGVYITEIVEKGLPYRLGPKRAGLSWQKCAKGLHLFGNSRFLH